MRIEVIVYFRKNGMQGSYGVGPTLDVALENARKEFRLVWCTRPNSWVVDAGHARTSGKFSTYKDIKQKVADAFNV